jgi:hypothetical protein
MRTESFHADDLAKALRRSKIATMPELKRALGTEVDVTVFRKLKQLAYRTSYSHRGSYYTLDETAHFDHNGLWSFQSVWFSRQGYSAGYGPGFCREFLGRPFCGGVGSLAARGDQGAVAEAGAT